MFAITDIASSALSGVRSRRVFWASFCIVLAAAAGAGALLSLWMSIWAAVLCVCIVLSTSALLWRVAAADSSRLPSVPEEPLDETIHHLQYVNRLLLNSMPQGVFWKDRQLNYLGCNQVFAAMAGLEKPEDIVGLSDYNLPWNAEETEFFRKIDREVIQSGEAKLNIVEPITRGEDGNASWLQTNKVPLKDSQGNIIGVLGTFQDITDLKHLEEQMRQSEQLRSVGLLAGGLAHDFNNMLGSIVGAAEMLNIHADSLEPSLQKYPEMILTTAHQAGELSQQLLAFSRKTRVSRVPFDINQTVEQVISILKHSLDKRILLLADLHEHPLVVVGDPTQIQNSVLNLAINARDSMPQGGLLTLATDHFQVTEETRDKENLDLECGPHAMISVTDTGTGIPEEVLEHIFEPFFTTKQIRSGSGLGLAAVYSTAKEHNGCITAASQLGRGSSFKMYFPATTTDLQVRKQEQFPEHLKGTGRILLVDDEEIIRSAALDMLKRLGYEVVPAADGREAIEAYKRFDCTFDLVILDLVMPKMGGRDTFQIIRALEPSQKILLASGFIFGEDIEELLASGAIGFIQKPYRLSTLSQKVHEALLKYYELDHMVC